MDYSSTLFCHDKKNVSGGAFLVLVFIFWFGLAWFSHVSCRRAGYSQINCRGRSLFTTTLATHKANSKVAVLASIGLGVGMSDAAFTVVTREFQVDTYSTWGSSAPKRKHAEDGTG